MNELPDPVELFDRNSRYYEIDLAYRFTRKELESAFERAIGPGAPSIDDIVDVPAQLPVRDRSYRTAIGYLTRIASEQTRYLDATAEQA